MVGIRKMFAGAAVPTTLNGAISGVASSIVVTNGTTYPDGSGGKFVVCIDRSLATEEKILITSRSGNTLTVSNRGYDGTAAQAHANAAVLEHVLDADTIDQVNRLANLLIAKGDLYVRDATDVQRVPVGANDTRLVADSTQALGVRWVADTENKLVDAKGDVLAASADNTLARLPVGANTTRLVADSTQATGLRWAPTTEQPLVDAKGDLLPGTADNTIARLAIGADGLILMADAASGGGMKWNSGLPRYGVSEFKNSQSIPSATTTFITFDTEVWDTHGFAVSPGANIIIPAGSDGLYLITAVTTFTVAAANPHIAELKIGGSSLAIVQSSTNPDAPGVGTAVINLVRACVATDNFALYVRQPSGVAQNVSAQLTFARLSA